MSRRIFVLYVLASLVLAILAPAHLAAARQESGDDILRDAYFEEHTLSAIARGFDVKDQSGDSDAWVTLVLFILDDDKPAERLFDDVTTAITEPDEDGTELDYETVTLDLDRLPSREAEAVLYQSVEDPEALISLGIAIGAIRLDNVVFYTIAFGSAGTGQYVIPTFEVFLKNAVTADEDDPASYLPTTSQLPAGYTRTGPDEQLYPETQS